MSSSLSLQVFKCHCLLSELAVPKTCCQTHHSTLSLLTLLRRPTYLRTTSNAQSTTQVAEINNALRRMRQYFTAHLFVSRQEPSYSRTLRPWISYVKCKFENKAIFFLKSRKISDDLSNLILHETLCSHKGNRKYYTLRM